MTTSPSLSPSDLAQRYLTLSKPAADALGPVTGGPGPTTPPGVPDQQYLAAVQAWSGASQSEFAQLSALPLPPAIRADLNTLIPATQALVQDLTAYALGGSNAKQLIADELKHNAASARIRQDLGLPPQPTPGSGG
jgi:hypothetical protein